MDPVALPQNLQRIFVGTLDRNHTNIGEKCQFSTIIGFGSEMPVSLATLGPVNWVHFTIKFIHYISKNDPFNSFDLCNTFHKKCDNYSAMPMDQETGNK